ncbi:unnamed protein product, partial [Ectocarpus sp. 8 AP-2014]
ILDSSYLPSLSLCLHDQERVAQQHRIANLCDGSTERSQGLHEIYEDTDGSMREE